MGDHILLASVFRSDILVFVLDLEMFNPAQLRRSTNYTLPEWHNLVIADSPEEAVRATEFYMRGFALATRRSDMKKSESESLLDARELFRVEAFMLYLNEKPIGHYSQYKSPPDNDFKSIQRRLTEIKESIAEQNERWQSLSKEIGARFGVSPDQCCCIAGDGSAHFGFNLLAYPTDQRVLRSSWPGRAPDN